MTSEAFRLPILESRFTRRGGVPWVLAVVVTGFMIYCGELHGQMVEERDSEEPSIERPARVPEQTVPDLSAAEQMILEQTNQFRSQQQLDAVKPNAELNETAQHFADFMARTGKYGHTADGQRPSERAENHGYEYCIVSENIAYQFRSSGFSEDELAKKIVNGWKNSPEHRKNILDPNVTEIGLAIARQADSPTYFAVQMFGRPKSKAISFQVTNESPTEVLYTVSRRGSEREFPLPPRMRRTHEQCRPTKVEFSDPETTLEVEDGAVFLVRRSPDGKLEVIRGANAANARQK